MSILRVSPNNAFSQYSRITSRYPDTLTPLPHNRLRHRPFLQIGKLTHLSSEMLILVLDVVGREGEEDLEEGDEGVFRSHDVIWEVGNKFREQRRASGSHPR